VVVGTILYFCYCILLHSVGDHGSHETTSVNEGGRSRTSDWGDIVTFVSAMFFSFEGIGLVLPVENSFTASYATLEEESKANHRYRRCVLPGAMSVVDILFIAIGISASLGYPYIENGSITAYLKEKYPNNLWLDIVNVAHGYADSILDVSFAVDAGHGSLGRMVVRGRRFLQFCKNHTEWSLSISSS
jgi:amino acid permease